VTDEIPVVMPVRARARTPLGLLLAAVAMAFVVGFASARVSIPGGAKAPDTPPATRAEPPRRVPGSGGPRFGAEAKPRLEALRDLLVRGLLSLRKPDGTWDSGDPRAQEVHRTETTALALAGLAAAKWMGAKDPALDPAIRESRAALVKRQAKDGSFGALVRGNTRDRIFSALSAAIVALALAGDPSDGPVLDRAGEALRHQWTLGPPVDYWTRALSIDAILALVGTGHGDALGPAPRSLLDRKTPGGRPDYRDHNVGEAFARIVRGDDPSGFPAQIAAICAEQGAEWGGERTDMYAWLMRAWLCARSESGDPWFAKALPGLEEGAKPDGVIEGDFYGDPVSRTACALLILLEGWTPQHPFGS
jgi:hypothetical protein